MGFKPRYERVTVYWADAACKGGWESFDSERAPIEVATTGYLTRQTSGHVEVSASVSTCSLGEVCVIPVGCIRRIERLRKGSAS